MMYCREGQQTEEEMYNNEEGGPAFNEFLDLIGERVKLKGFNKYKAGLCNKSELFQPHTITHILNGISNFQMILLVRGRSTQRTRAMKSCSTSLLCCPSHLTTGSNSLENVISATISSLLSSKSQVPNLSYQTSNRNFSTSSLS